jgi:RNA polymerase-associated protein LEO1
MRQLDDEDLDSGDDEGRNDRVATQEAADEAEEKTFSFMDADIARHPVPEPSDGELYLLKVPRFLEFEPTAFNPKTFEAPTQDHHLRTGPSEHFSAFDTAMTTIRWRRSPNNPKQLQSNARVLRWSDGSLTLQLASQPLEQYEINANPLAPPQIKPKKPTPTSVLHKTGAEGKESYTYLVAPYEEAQVMRITNKITTSLSVVPTATSKDTALDELQSALAKAASRTLDSKNQAISFVDVHEDPELARQRKEAEYKLQLKQQRAREKNEMRQREKTGGSRRSAGYGLSVGGLEDEDGGRRGGARKPAGKGLRRADWSDDEDYGMPRRGNKEDEYDEEDDFIAGSDEEPEVVSEDDEEELLDSPPRRGQQAGSPKRNRGRDDDDDDDEEEVVVSRTKRRRVVEDDDEDE